MIREVAVQLRESNRMAYCYGCGRYVGDYSSYKHNIAGKGNLALCYKCKKWADRHPGRTAFPSRKAVSQNEGRRVRTFASIYIIGSLGLFALGMIFILASRRIADGILFLLAGLSLFFIGVGMRKFTEK